MALDANLHRAGDADIQQLVFDDLGHAVAVSPSFRADVRTPAIVSVIAVITGGHGNVILYSLTLSPSPFSQITCVRAYALQRAHLCIIRVDQSECGGRFRRDSCCMQWWQSDQAV